jgi:2-methylisocitrate lyase-like PEP mutase family enzyme
MTTADILKQLLQARAGVEVPGCQDAIGARLIETCGFPAAYVSSFSIAATRGVPDVGILSLTEIAQCVESIAQSVKIPVVVDGDAGHGSILNVRECVRRFELAGAAGLHIEDQVKPRRVMKSKELIPVSEMQEKIAAAVAARSDPSFQIIARTDAVITRGGLEEALNRARAYEDAGADAAIVMYLTDLKDIRAAAKALRVPMIVVLTETIRPVFPPEALRQAGVAMTIWALGLTLVAAAAMKRALTALRRQEDPQLRLPEMIEFAELNRILGYDDFSGWETGIRDTIAAANAIS